MLYIEKLHSSHDQTPGLIDIFVKHNENALKYGTWCKFTAINSHAYYPQLLRLSES